jgi:urea transport system substrate-binding protein
MTTDICTTSLAAQQVEARKIPVMGLSVSARELQGVDVSRLVGHMAARNYFQSVTTPENTAFVKMWTDFNDQRDQITNDPMEATLIGFRMWAQAVTQAGTSTRTRSARPCTARGSRRRAVLRW